MRVRQLKKLTNLLMVFMGLVVGEHQASADLIFWTDETAGTIGRANIDGSGATNILQTYVPPQGIAAGPNGTIYWGDYVTDTVHRINSDGTGNTPIATGAGEVRGIAVDSAGGKVYWADSGGGYPTIQRSNLDGSNVQSIASSTYQPGQFYSAIGVALDVPDGRVFWTDPAGGSIWSSNLDGSNAGIAISGLTNPFMLAIDTLHHTVYWSSNTNVDSANLDGSDEHAVVTGLVNARGIALDVNADKMFIVDNGAGSILSANLDGSGLRTIVSGLEFPTGITVQVSAVPEPSTLVLSSLGAVLLGSWAWIQRLKERSR